mmetsp:Transcript_908/g.2107  ORF Transcript_908/g.2107 Transcript_908/m.2107 type:complete len:206 (+) Transcript_908:103-720(+)
MIQTEILVLVRRFCLSFVQFRKEEQNIDIEFEEVSPSRDFIERINSGGWLNKLRRIHILIDISREDFDKTRSSSHDSSSSGDSQLSWNLRVNNDTLCRERSSRQTGRWVDEGIREEAVSLNRVLVGRSNAIADSINCDNEQNRFSIDINWYNLRADVLRISHDFVEQILGTESESVARSIRNDWGNNGLGVDREKRTSESDSRAR